MFLSPKLSKNIEELGFTIVKNLIPEERNFMGRNIGEIEIKADTLFVAISVWKAYLFQKEPKPFTQKDVKLRETIFKFYRHNRQTPVPLEFQSEEPRFEVDQR